MAFNPFESFRKNNKAIMALLAIVCMITFVFSSGLGGGGDIFDWISRQFGAEDRGGPVLGEVLGNEYHLKDLQEMRMARSAANDFMMEATRAADQQMFNQIEQDLKNKTIKDKQAEQILSTTIRIRTGIITGTDPNAAVMAPYFYQMWPRQLAQALQTLDPKDNQADYRAVRRMLRILLDDQRILFDNRRGRMFFPSIPNVNDGDTLLFAMYLREADKMGVKLVDDDVKKMIGDATENLLNGQDLENVDKSVRRKYGGLTTSRLFKAISDEFRTTMAHGILTGMETFYNNRSSFPADMTPFEFFEFYKDRCTENTYTLIEVPVERFVAKVEQTPTEKELASFFDDYRQVEFDPARETPGFKELRKSKVEYVGVDAKLPAYQWRSNSVRGLEAASAILGGLIASNGSDVFAGITTIAEPQLAESSHVANEIAQSVKSKMDGPMFHVVVHGFPFVIARPNDSNFYHPRPSAALAAQLAVMRNPFTDLPAALAAHYNLANFLATRDRAVVGLQLTVAPIAPAPVGLNSLFPLPAIAAVAVNAPKIPYGVYYAEELQRQRENGRPERLAKADFESLQKKLKDLREKAQPPQKDSFDPKTLQAKKSSPSKLDPKVIAEANSEARKLVDEWIKARPGVLTGKSKDLHDKYSMDMDPGLLALYDLVRLATLPYESFANAFFQDGTPGKDPTKDAVAASLYNPVVFPDLAMPNDARFYKPVYLAWKIEDVAPHAYPKLSDATPEMREKVVLAWKMKRARDLAHNAADKLAGEIRDLAKAELRDANNPDSFNKGLHDKTIGYRMLNPVTLAKLALKPDVRSPERDAPNDYAQTPLSTHQIPYPMKSSAANPNGDMAEQLLGIRSKPLGETLVIPDAPRSRFYVCVLSHKNVPNVDQFNNLVFKTMNSSDRGTPPDILYSRYAMEVAETDFKKDVTERLKAETKYKETDALKKLEKSETPEQPNE